MGLSSMAQRALVGAITVRRGHQSSPRQQGSAPPHPASTADVGCQHKPAQPTKACAASVRARLEVGPSELGEQDKPAAPTPCSCSRPAPTWRGETTKRDAAAPGEDRGRRWLITAAVRQALFGLHRTEQKKKQSFPPSPVGERLSLASCPTCDPNWAVNLRVS